MKRTLKESVRDINNMIGRIDHPTIVEGPGDEVGSDTNVKHVVQPIAPAVEKDIEKQIMSYIVDNRDAAELKRALFKKAPKLDLGPSTKLGALVSNFKQVGADLSMSPLGKQPISVGGKLGDNIEVNIDWEGKLFKIPLKAHFNTTLLQKEKGFTKLTKGFRLGGIYGDITIPIEYTDKKMSQLSKGKKL